MCRMVNCLRAHGVGRGDRVAIYMPTSPDAVAAILACARIGALHSVVFAGKNCITTKIKNETNTVELRSKGFHGTGLIFPID